jgi:hypothetical protein
MRTFYNILTIVLITIWQIPVYGNSPDGIDSLRLEVLLGSKMLDDINLNIKFVNSLNVTPDQHILLSTTNQFYLLGWGGIKPVGQKVTDTISSFAYTPDGFLMIAHNKELCYIDSLGKLTHLYELPGIDMGITAGKNVIYVYDRDKEQKKHALYILAKGHKYIKLFEISTPITSVLEMNETLLFATENKLFSVNPKSKDIKALAALPKDKKIISLGVDTLNSRIYFSTDSVVCTLKDSSVVIITNEFGGVLRFFNDGLIVFNPEKKFLVRILGIEDNITSKMLAMKAAANDKPTTDMLTNSAVINMVKTKLSDDIIVNIINKSAVNFSMGVDSMIFLSNQSVSSAVIMAMKNAMKRKAIVKNFYIISGSYPTEQQANDATADLKRKGFPEAEVVGKNSYGSFRIAYKVYATSDEAAKDLTDIKQTINPSAWIFEKKQSN